VLLETALDSLDYADAARQTIQAEGETHTKAKSKMRHLHPLISVEREARRTFLRLWLKLGLHWDHAIDSRLDD